MFSVITSLNACIRLDSIRLSIPLSMGCLSSMNGRICANTSCSAGVAAVFGDSCIRAHSFRRCFILAFIFCLIRSGLTRTFPLLNALSRLSLSLLTEAPPQNIIVPMIVKEYT